MSKPNFTAERLRELLEYAPLTGTFTWIVATSNRVRVGDIAGSIHASGYRYICVDGKRYGAHRLAWLHVSGGWPSHHVDHRDGNPGNNRIANLRDVTQLTNTQNVRRARSNNLLGILGVSYENSRWKAQIKINGKNLNLGSHSTPELAHAAYLAAKREFHSGCTI